MITSLRTLLAAMEPDEEFPVHAPDIKMETGFCQYQLIWAARLHYEMIFLLPDGGFHQVNIAFLRHPTTNGIHAFVIASHEDHEGCWQEFISCDEILDCLSWDDFLDTLYGYQLDSGLDLSLTNRDAFFRLIPEWIELPV